MVDRSKNRSNAYQHLFAESLCSPEMITEFCDAQGFASAISSHNEEMLDLQEELIKNFWRIVKKLTPRQQQVLKLMSEGKTQVEIAKLLEVNQSSVVKSVGGNVDYSNGRMVYGGSRKKLLKLASEDPVLQNIFKRIAEISNK